MTDLDHFLVGALRDVSGVGFQLEEEPDESESCCGNGGWPCQCESEDRLYSTDRESWRNL